MLSERDHRILDEIEREFVRSSPRLARRLRRRTSWGMRFAYDVAAVLAGSAALLCVVVVRQGTGGAAAVAAVLLVGLLAARHRRYPYRAKGRSVQGRGLARS